MTAPAPDFAALVREQAAASRAARPTGPRVLRASSLGHCARKVAYGLLGAPVEVEASSHLALLGRLGDEAERAVVAWLRGALDAADFFGPLGGWELEATGGEQATVVYRVETPAGPLDIVGHMDGRLTEDGGARAVLEVKSGGFTKMAEWDRRIRRDFAVFEPTDDDGYWWQLQAYLHADGADRAYVVVTDRAGGAITGAWLARDARFAEMLQWHLATIVVAMADIGTREAPGPNLGAGRRHPGGDVVAPVAAISTRGPTKGKPTADSGSLPLCSQCDFWRACWGDAVVVKNTGGRRGVWAARADSRRAA